LVETEHRLRIEAELIIHRVDQAARYELVQIWGAIVQIRHVAAGTACGHRLNEHARVAREDNVRSFEVAGHGTA